jgi:hypothetical protein
VYRIRGVYAEMTAERNVITTKQHTNFLKFSKNSLIFRELAISVNEDVEEEDPEELLLKPKYVTRVTSEH